MRGALEPLNGISTIQIAVGEPKFSVTFDEQKVAVPEILAALEKAGETATVRDD